MKTLNNIITITLSLMISISSFATSFGQQDEQYINDIPFNTKAIFDSLQNGQDIDPSLTIQQEEYISDIPFDTEKIVAQYRSDSAMKVNFKLPEEETINDIPFNTLYIMSNVLYSEYDRFPVTFISSRK